MYNTTAAISEQKELIGIRPIELFYLFQKMNQRKDISIRIKKENEVEFGNPCSVIRASNSLIMIKDHVSGEVQFLSELRAVTSFVLDKNCAPYQANVHYKVA